MSPPAELCFVLQNVSLRHLVHLASALRLMLLLSRYGADAQSYGMATALYRKGSCEQAVKDAMKEVGMLDSKHTLWL